MSPKKSNSPRGQLCAQRQEMHPLSRWQAPMVLKLTKRICATYEDQEGVNVIDGINMPQSKEVIRLLELMLEVFFPGYTGRRLYTRAGIEFAIGDHISEIYMGLVQQIQRAIAYRCRKNACPDCDCLKQAETAVLGLLERFPCIREMLKTDVRAAMDGDPAARSTDEIVIAYPGLKAIAVQRIAHELYISDIPLIPRVMTEYAHGSTGIDIHPGATIGESFFIDHGTGTVIGETAVIGRNVKLYQGVTLGALSFKKDEKGCIIKGGKRHPNLDDNVTVYSGATILGDITIGHDSVIGGNVWLTASVPPYSRVTIAPPELSITSRPPKKKS